MPERRTDIDRRLGSGRSKAARTPVKKVAAVIVLFALTAALAANLSSHSNDSRDAPESVRTSYTTHAPIIIMRDTDFTNASGVVWGSGTADDPYIISGWDIDTEYMDACIFVFRTTVHFVIKDCHLHMRGAVCLETQEAPNGDIIDNLIDEGDYGIFVTKSPNANVSGNTVSNMDSLGIGATSSDRVNISGNTARNNNNTNYLCSRVSNLTFEDNFAFDGNFTGIWIYNVTEALIVGNNASENDGVGMRIDEARDAVVQGNNITSNLGCGVRVANSTNVTIFHNNFIGNSPNAFQETSSLIRWNESYPTGGNHWSDYSGIDIYGGPGQDEIWSDGFGDTPYTVVAGVEDAYPMTGEAQGPLIPEFDGAILPAAAVLVTIAFLVSRSGKE